MDTVAVIIVLTCSLYFAPVSECLSCYDCSPTSQDNCTEVIPGVSRTVPCSNGVCYADMSGSSFTRSCTNDTQKNCSHTEICCTTDLCNTVMATTIPSRPPVECYQCTYRVSDGTINGHSSCTRDDFNALHPLVKTKDCSFGCSVSEVIAEDTRGSEYILSRDCAAEGYCNSSCIQQPGFKSCTTCCEGALCNGAQATSGDAMEDSSKGDQCYSCYYLSGPSGKLGSQGCYEPFKASDEGIQKVPCDGECSLSIVRDGDSVVVQRACQPRCVPSCEIFGDSENCVYCCSGSLCNSATFISDNLSWRIVCSVLIVFLSKL